MERIKQKINKITVLGAGTAGCITASFLKKNTNAEIEWIYDSGTPAQSVGEGSTIPLARGFFNEINLNVTTLDLMGGSIKKGIRKIGWGGIGDYLHEFPMGEYAIHFNSRMLQQFVPQRLETKGVDIIDRKILNHDDVDTDYIVDCTGRPSNWEDYTQSDLMSVNAVHVVQAPCRGPLFDFTFCVARPYGWVFCIPLAERTSCGYLYNSTFNTLDEVKEDMKEFMAEFKFQYSEEQNNFEFKNYHRKENYTERVCYNGNASFFLEPLEATSVGTVDLINRRLLDTIRLDLSLQSSNDWYTSELRETQHMIMMHYYAGSKYDTPFWTHAKSKGLTSMKQMVESNKFRDIAAMALENFQQPEFDKMVGMEYGQWPAYSYWQNLKGLGIARDVDNLIKDFETK